MAAFIWLWTGSAWKEALCDASGHFQVDILSSALPTGAATESTLSSLLTELGAKLETGDLSIEATTKYLNAVVKTCANPSNLDQTITALIAAIRGASTKDFTTLETDIEAIKANQIIQLSRNVTWLFPRNSATNGTAIIHTVTSGKTFYLIAGHLSAEHFAAGDHFAYVGIRDGADATVTVILRAGGPDAENYRTDRVQYPIPIEIPAGYDIFITAIASTAGWADLIGWEE